MRSPSVPQVMVDASGIMLARPDNYLPPVDIIKDADEKYTIYLDVPGMTRENIRLSRQNVVTIVKVPLTFLIWQLTAPPS